MGAIILLLFIFGLTILFFFQEYFKYKKKSLKKVNLNKSMPDWRRVQQVLESHFLYYQNLSPSLKDEFINRCLSFCKQIKWLSPKGESLDPSKKILISASAIQLTFGLPKFDFGRFKKILVYENSYFNRQTQQHHKGEVNQHGLIVLSWKYFVEGYADPKDRINLGLHEMAHAMDLALYLSQGRSYYQNQLMKHFQNSAFEEFTRLRQGHTGTLRSYGGTNLREFFSVSVEHFFEDPKELSQKLPKLYLQLCRLLNQDPLNKINRGFQPAASTFSNKLHDSVIKFTKPNLKIRPNIYIAIPLIITTCIASLIGIALNTIVNSPPYLSWILLAFFSLTLYTQLNIRGMGIDIYDKHLAVKKFFKHKHETFIHTSNILHIDITYMLTHYDTELVYFDDDKVKELKLPLYTKPKHIKQLEKIMLNQKVMVKHNNKWQKRS